MAATTTEATADLNSDDTLIAEMQNYNGCNKATSHISVNVQAFP